MSVWLTMYYTLSLAILFLGVFFHGELIHAKRNNHDEISLHNCEQLFTPANESLNLDGTVISGSISDGIEILFGALGLINLDKYKQNGQLLLTKRHQLNNIVSAATANPILYEIFSCLSNYLPIGLGILSPIQDLFRKNNYRQMGYLLSDSSLPKIITRNSPHELKIVSIPDKAEKYVTAYFHCWNKNITLFNVPNAFAEILKYPPKITKKLPLSRLTRAVPKIYADDKHYSQFNAMICHLSIRNQTRRVFRKCLKQFQLIEKCIEVKFEKPSDSDQFKLRLAQQLNKNLNALNSTCKVEDIKKNSTFTYEPNSNNTKKNPLLIILKEFVGNSFMRSATSNKIVGKFGKIISNSKLGSEILYEVAGLLEIYKQAIIKKKELLIKPKMDPRVITEYNKHSQQLLDYTKSLRYIATYIVNRICIITTTIAKTLIDIATTALGVDLSNNSRSMRCFNTIWNKIKNKLIIVNFYKQQSWQQTWRFKHFLEKINNSNLKDFHGKLISNLSLYFHRDWLAALRNLGRVKTHRHPSTITKLTNTFLQATMFYECIVISAGPIHRTENENHTQMQPITPPIEEQMYGNQQLTIYDGLAEYRDYFPSEYEQNKKQRIP